MQPICKVIHHIPIGKTRTAIASPFAQKSSFCTFHSLLWIVVAVLSPLQLAHSLEELKLLFRALKRKQTPVRTNSVHIRMAWAMHTLDLSSFWCRFVTMYAFQKMYAPFAVQAMVMKKGDVTHIFPSSALQFRWRFYFEWHTVDWEICSRFSFLFLRFSLPFLSSVTYNIDVSTKR